MRRSFPPRQPVLISHYYPATLSGGIAVRGQNWTVEGDVIFSFWSSFDTVVFSAPLNAVQGPVRTQFGYHLIEVTSRTG